MLNFDEFDIDGECDYCVDNEYPLKKLECDEDEVLCVQCFVTRVLVDECCGKDIGLAKNIIEFNGENHNPKTMKKTRRK